MGVIILLVAIVGIGYLIYGIIVQPNQPSLSVSTYVFSNACEGELRAVAQLSEENYKRIPDALLDFYVDGDNLDSLLTDKNGRVIFESPVKKSWCGREVNIEVRYAGYLSSPTNYSSKTIIQAPTVITLDQPEDVDEGGGVTTKVRLINAINNEPLEGKTLFLDGLNGTTDSDGAVVFHLLAETPGSTAILASFTGDKYFEPSSSETKMVVNPLICSDGTKVGQCSKSYLCNYEKKLEFSCENCGCYNGLLCIDGDCVSKEEKNTKTIESLQKSSLKVISDEGIGSGVIIDRKVVNGIIETLVLTNRHVVDPSFKLKLAKNLEVHNFYNETGKAEAVFVAPYDIDLAVIIVKKDIGPKVLIKNDKDPKVGAELLVIGSPLGIQNSVTTGIVSNFVETNTSSGYDYTAIQTDAAVNPGNSGGGVFLSDSGELVGIASFKLLIKSNQLAEGLGFAMPVSLLKKFPITKWEKIE